MPNSILVLAIAAVLTAGAAFWALRAYRRAGGQNARAALGACGAVAVLALGGYLLIGNPDMPDGAYETRLQALKGRELSSFTVDEALAILHEAARDNPNDPLPHFYTGQLLLDQGRAEEAARAYDMALRRDPTNVQAMLGMGRALVSIEGGRVSPEALALFQQAGEMSNEPAPWIYQAMAAMENGREVDARRLWGEALTRMSPEDPRREMARRMSAGEGAN